MPQSVESPALDFSSGHALTVCDIELCTGFYADRVEPTWDSLARGHACSLSLLMNVNALTLKINKQKKPSPACELHRGRDTELSHTEITGPHKL